MRYWDAGDGADTRGRKLDGEIPISSRVATAAAGVGVHRSSSAQGTSLQTHVCCVALDAGPYIASCSKMPCCLLIMMFHIRAEPLACMHTLRCLYFMFVRVG